MHRQRGKPMTKIFAIIDDSGTAIGPDFNTWEEAIAYKNEHQIPGFIMSADELVDDFSSNPEPQEMTAAWVRKMERDQ